MLLCENLAGEWLYCQTGTSGARNNIFFSFWTSGQWDSSRHWRTSQRHSAHHSDGQQWRFLQDESSVRDPRQLLLQSSPLGLGYLQVQQTLPWYQTRWVFFTLLRTFVKHKWSSLSGWQMVQFSGRIKQATVELLHCCFTYLCTGAAANQRLACSDETTLLWDVWITVFWRQHF